MRNPIPDPVVRGVSRSFAVAVAVALLALLTGCPRQRPQPLPGATADPAASRTQKSGHAIEQQTATVRVTLLHLNDIYEITPISGGREGGAARVATLLDSLRLENPNTISVLAGDLFSPSALGTAKVDGKRLNGAQMVAVLNALSLDICTFGNHEFDIGEEDFRARLAESQFGWVSGNVRDATGQPFPGVDEVMIRDFTDPATHATLRIGFLAVTMTANNPGYVTFREPFATAAKHARQLSATCDVVIAVTHQSAEDDARLARLVPEIDLILGGHEHENMQLWRGSHTPILKADANVRTVYVVRLEWNTVQRELQMTTELVPINNELADHPRVAAVVDEWQRRGFAAFEAAGFAPTEHVVNVPEPLDGLEASVRNRSTLLTQLVAAGMHAAASAGGTNQIDLALYNGGAIRIDDVLPAGPVSQYDVIRILPFGGTVVRATIRGRDLGKLLNAGQQNRGAGGWLQTTDNVALDRASGSWLLDGQPLDPEKTYTIAVNDFLLTGRERGMQFLADNPEVVMVSEHGDIRKALIEELRRRFGSGSD